MINDLEDLVANYSQPRVRQNNYKLKHKLRKEKGLSRASAIDQDGLEVDFHVNSQVIPGTQKIFVKTFGCSHNTSDSEFMMGQLVSYGYSLVDSIQEAELVLINSCTVKNPSQQSFLQVIEQARQFKKFIVVAGCVPQGDSTIPELQDLSIVGVTQIDRVVEVVEETLKGNKVQLLQKKELPSLDLPKIRRNKFIEIVPINTGCLGSCTYCKTKHARGKLGSYQPQAIVNRIRSVIQNEGVKQIWLTSEDTGAYGRDIGYDISYLLKNIVDNLPGGTMLRIGMTNPPYILEHLQNIAILLKHPRVFEFIHIPVQSGSNYVLEDMNREYTIEEFKHVCDYLKEQVPGIMIVTDIICGFPTETDEQFEETLNLVDKYKFKALNISQFYARPGTAAFHMKKLDSKVVKQRSQKLTQLFESQSQRYQDLLGKQLRVYIHEYEIIEGETYYVGHTKQYTKVIFKNQIDLLGKEVIIKVDKIFKWHVEGTILDSNPEFEIPSKEHFSKFFYIKHSQTQEKVDAIMREQNDLTTDDSDGVSQLKYVKKEQQRQNIQNSSSNCCDENQSSNNCCSNDTQNQKEEQCSCCCPVEKQININDDSQKGKSKNIKYMIALTIISLALSFIMQQFIM